MNAGDDALQALRNDASGGDAGALFRLGRALVERGRMDEAAAALSRAAHAGQPSAQVELARMLLHGVGTGVDLDAAVRWLERAEAASDASAAYLLALVALGGVALPRDARINQRLVVAANAGHPLALRALAVHFGRRPHADDQALCLRLLRDAAGGGDVVAAALLAERLARGEGTAPDPAAAARLRARFGAGEIALLPETSAATPWQPPSSPREVAIEDALLSAPATELSTRPRVASVDALLSRDECRLLIASTRELLRSSRTVDPASGESIAASLRTSSDASVDPIQEDFALRAVQLRMCASAGIDLVHAERLIVLRYEPGQEYRPHRDYLPPGAIERDSPAAGNRARTICAYLNDVDAGGGTAFSATATTVAPVAGNAVVFDNLLPDGSPDPDSMHAGLPVERGEKWLATLWLRQGRYRAF